MLLISSITFLSALDIGLLVWIRIVDDYLLMILIELDVAQLYSDTVVIHSIVHSPCHILT